MKQLRGMLSLAVITLLSTANSFGQTTTNKNVKQEKTVTEMFEDMDVNQDKQLSKDELPESMKMDFEKMDLDKSGFISLKELEQAMKPKATLPLEK